MTEEEEVHKLITSGPGPGLLLAGVLGAANAQPMPDLSAFGYETRQSMELACIIEKSRGPVPYRQCLNNQIAALQLSPSIPDLSRFDYTTRQSLQLACIMVKAEGPASYARCLRAQIDAVRDSPGIPELSSLDRVTRQSLELACITQKAEGPTAYAHCLRSQLQTFQNSPGLPSLAGLDRLMRQSIEIACITEKASGPSAYGLCLRAQLRSIGVKPTADEEIAHSAPPPAMPRNSQRSSPQTESKPDVSVRAPVRLKPAGVELPRWVPVPSSLNLSASQFGQPLAPANVFKAVEKSVYVLISAKSETDIRQARDVSQGSAVAVSEKLAMTNCHVVGGNRVHFLVKGETVLQANVVAGDKESDRCLLEVKADGLIPVRGVRPHATLAVGERVYTVGSPSGLENSLGEGIVSGLRSKLGVNLVQTSAPISPGSSGGGLFDAAGNLVGITTFLLRDSQNLNFAISADEFWR